MITLLVWASEAVLVPSSSSCCLAERSRLTMSWNSCHWSRFRSESCRNSLRGRTSDGAAPDGGMLAVIPSERYSRSACFACWAAYPRDSWPISRVKVPKEVVRIRLVDRGWAFSPCGLRRGCASSVVIHLTSACAHRRHWASCEMPLLLDRSQRIFIALQRSHADRRVISSSRNSSLLSASG